MRESLRRRLKLPPLHHHHHHHPPPPPPPRPASTKPELHPPNDDELEEGELKDGDPLDLSQNKDDRVEQDREPIVSTSPVKDVESHDRGVVADDGGDGKPECPVADQKSELKEEDVQMPLVVPVVEDNVTGDDVNQGVREERGNQSGELLEVRVGGGGEEAVVERNETEQAGGEVVVKVAVVDVVQPDGEQADKNTDSLGEGEHKDGDGTPERPVEEEREITTEQQPAGGGETVENDIAMEVDEEERGQPDMPVEMAQNLIDNQHEATAGENEGKTDNEQVEKVTEKDGVDDDDDEEEDGPPPGWESGPPVKPLPPFPPPPPPPPPEKGQLVCGSCRRLLSYPRGFKHVQCSCCQTVNYVLEEHQVGQVQCGNCLLLLMYPYGAQSVRCCSCRVVTDIGDHNKRPRLSEQQSRACRPFCVPL